MRKHKNDPKFPKEVQIVSDAMDTWMEQLKFSDIGYVVEINPDEEFGWKTEEEYMEYLRKEEFCAWRMTSCIGYIPDPPYGEGEWVVGSEDCSCIYQEKEKRWVYRRQWDGADSVVKGGTNEVIANLQWSITC